MRGKPAREGSCGLCAGITPADAGKTLTVCRIITFRPGSPPRMRGKLPQFVILPEEVGITPAGAGKTTLTPAHNIPNKDHPRRCGENMMPSIFRSASQGSPPQVRGKRTRLYCNLTDNRITPAGAGKTEDLEEFVVLQLDHPRRCGENHAQSHDPLYNQGSPPQVRGKQGKKLK